MSAWQHDDAARGRWRSLSLAEQFGNVGSEVSRAIRWSTKNPETAQAALYRGLELFDLMLDDPQRRGSVARLREIARAREVVVDFLAGSNSTAPPVRLCRSTSTISLSPRAAHTWRVSVRTHEPGPYCFFPAAASLSAARAPRSMLLQRVVPLVARVLVELLVARHPRVFAGPGPVPRLGIFDGEPVQQRLVVDAREPLDDFQLLARSVELRLVGEVRRLDDERVAFPPADRIAQPPCGCSAAGAVPSSG